MFKSATQLLYVPVLVKGDDLLGRYTLKKLIKTSR